MQLQAPVGAEHRHALFQGVERLALHAGQRVDLRFELEALAHIVEEIGDAALRIGIGDDAQRAPVGQMPPGLARLDRRDRRPGVRLPGAEIRLFGQFACGAQTIEHFAVGRARGEEGLIERPELLIGGIAEDEILAPSKIATAVGN